MSAESKNRNTGVGAGAAADRLWEGRASVIIWGCLIAPHPSDSALVMFTTSHTASISDFALA